MFVIKGKKTFARVFADQIDDTTRKQIEQIVDHPAMTNPISIMPDCHAGKGCVIGFTMQAGDCVIPNLIGVDISCGVTVYHLKNVSNVHDHTLGLDLKLLDHIIKEHIPSGMKIRNTPLVNADRSDIFSCVDLYGKIKSVCEKIEKTDKLDHFLASIGTLGGGNHLIEVDFDPFRPEEGVYLTIHTGSRNFGLCIANYFQAKAKELCQAMHIDVPSGTEFLPMKYGGYEYMKCMRIAQEYASANRHMIAHEIINNLFPNMTINWEIIESVHNYISPRGNMIRKGAISAHAGEKVVIPLNMRDGVLLGVGKGNKDWNFSAPHGAGRKMSRTEAKKTLDMKDFTESMKGIYSSTVCQGTLDEAPGAYKDSQLIIDSIGDTVEIERHIRPIYNFKATEEE